MFFPAFGAAMLFAHPDDLLELAKIHQAEIRAEAISEPKRKSWRSMLIKLVDRLAARPEWLADESNWPLLRDYPYPW